LERNLADWSSSPLQMFTFDGNTGEYKMLDGSGPMPAGAKFIAVLDETQKGWIKFDRDGGPPVTHMVRIAEETMLKEREELGDCDPAQWPIGLSGHPEDPWQLQYVVPLQSPDDGGGEPFALVARSKTAMNAVGNLLGRWRWHHKRKLGGYPVIEIKAGTYHNKKFNVTKPKPIFQMTGEWVNRDGAPLTPTQQPKLSDEMNDDVPF
jgi:hypothetical protein